MYSACRALIFTCLTLLLPLPAYAVSIVAEGRALILSQDVNAARHAAIQDAKTQASMQGAVYVSSNQQVKNGILELDNMQIDTLGEVTNIEVLNSRIEGRQYIVQIRADVSTDLGCENNQHSGLMKSVAIAAFPMVNPLQANLGALHDIQTTLAAKLQHRLKGTDYLRTLNAGHINLHPDTQNAPTRQLNDGALTTLVSNADTLDVQYIISGVIRDMSMLDPSVANEQNFFIDTYNRLDFKSKKHNRGFAIDMFIHDAMSGRLMWQKSYYTAGAWPFEPEKRTGFATSAFYQTPYGQSVNKLLKQVGKELRQELRCQPFSARITRVQGQQIWFNAGQQSGLKNGDKLSVYRRSTAYTDGLQSIPQVSSAQATTIIEEVHPTFSIGRLHNDAGVLNIRSEDIVKSQ